MSNSPAVSGASTVTKAHTKEKPSAKLPKVPVETEKRNCTLGRSFEGISLSLALFPLPFAVNPQQGRRFERLGFTE
jgi:hypothetical protein